MEFSMENKTAILESFDNNKLIDVIKNYRQYGYDKDLRKTAMKILIDRGITIKDLKLTGNLVNKDFDSAEDLIKCYERNSKRAFILYITVLVLNVLVPVLKHLSEFLSETLLVVNFVFLVLFLISLYKAFQNQYDFYRLIGKKMDSYEVLSFLLIGIPFYVFMYFYYKHKLRDELKMIK